MRGQTGNIQIEFMNQWQVMFNLQRLLHSGEHPIGEVFSAYRFDPQNDQNEWQNEADVQQKL